MEYAIIHYSEIGLKGKNRPIFENLLKSNIQKKSKLKNIKKEYGYLIAEVDNKDKLRNILSKIPGISHFVFAKESKLNKEDILKTTLDLLKDVEFNTFKIDTKRHNKNFEFTSMELNRDIGEKVLETLNKKVEIRTPEVNVIIEICNKEAYVGFERVEGVGGLPTDPKNKVVSLLSGGFDSPIASYMLMKRGAEVIFVHFQNYSELKASVKDKIEQLVKVLSQYQVNTKLYIIPFENLQKEIIAKVPADTRMLIYRRFMLRIADKILEKEKAQALITGDSMSQVASQTLENLNAVYSVTDSIIFNPLIGFNKDEIINLSRKIGTEEISKLPYGDCCSFFLPKHPKTKGNIRSLDKAEINLDVDKLVEDSLKKVKVKNF